jgi:hypothetical protein
MVTELLPELGSGGLALVTEAVVLKVPATAVISNVRTQSLPAGIEPAG